MPNATNINKLISFISSLPPEQFEMSQWERPAECGTVACLGGWAERLISPSEPAMMNTINSWLDIDDKTSKRLFFMSDDIMGLGAFDRLEPSHRQQAAITVLQRLRDENVVDWHVAVLATGPQPEEEPF